MFKRLLIVLSVIILIILVPYFLGTYLMANYKFNIAESPQEIWLYGFAVMLILFTIIMILIRVYQYIKYGV